MMPIEHFVAKRKYDSVRRTRTLITRLSLRTVVTRARVPLLEPSTTVSPPLTTAVSTLPEEQAV
jgi:hypothetical protein